MKLIDTQSSLSDLQLFLQNLNWITDEEITGLTIPGAGNMNVVMRVTTNKRSFILKQSRPYVQKYQDIPAPLQRIETEFKFYKSTDQPELKMHLPQILAYDSAEHLLMMEDLGDCNDLTLIYKTRDCSHDTLAQLVTILKRLHRLKAPSDYPKNTELRLLNHQHIFALPFTKDNGFNLDDIQIGLQDLSIQYKEDIELRSAINEVGQLYLSEGNTLLHGDYYPGSWMKTTNQLYILDPEFSFVGYKEFDVGVLVAHLIIASSNEDYLPRVIQLYDGKLNIKLLKQTAGIEIMRRIIGLAQLPLIRDLSEKRKLLEMAHGFIMGGSS